METSSIRVFFVVMLKVYQTVYECQMKFWDKNNPGNRAIFVNLWKLLLNFRNVFFDVPVGRYALEC
jgi:hypothetical protein